MSISCNRNVLVVKDHVSSLSMPERHTAPRRNFSRCRIGDAARPSPAGTREIAAIQRFSLVSSCQSKNETLNVAHLVRYQNLEGRPVERIRRGRKGLIGPMIPHHFRHALREVFYLVAYESSAPTSDTKSIDPTQSMIFYVSILKACPRFLLSFLHYRI